MSTRCLSKCTLTCNFPFGFGCIIADPPNVTALEPVQLIVNQTQPASFVCQAYGIPTPNISWVRLSDGALLNDSFDGLNISENFISPDTLESTLTFSSTKKTDESEYRCEGNNGVTNVISSPESDMVELLVQGLFFSLSLQE